MMEAICNISEKFWYYINEKVNPRVIMGPYTKQELKSFLESKEINDSTLVWHPTLKDWKYIQFVRPFNKPKNDNIVKIIQFIEELKKDNNDKPVFLLQGYLHIQRKHSKEQWKPRWISMVAKSDDKNSHMEKSSMDSSIAEKCNVEKTKTQIFLCVSSAPDIKPKKELNLENCEIIPNLIKIKNEELMFTVKEKDGPTNIVFWSPNVWWNKWISSYKRVQNCR